MIGTRATVDGGREWGRNKRRNVVRSRGRETRLRAGHMAKGAAAGYDGGEGRAENGCNAARRADAKCSAKVHRVGRG